ncbi:S8 family serine peptidase [Geoalkalibacter sp.]|uniref:S8 family serine peptidase n=1 Tax=Geoalkalibacter sp. TaxID=3041440 RepID=UPI00272EDDC4|nr:S8 family serine peptidase [Geoalkalibacter sp.]
MKRHSWKTKIVVALALCCGVLAGGVTSVGAQGADFVPGELLIRHKPGAAAAAKGALQAQGAVEIEEIAGIAVKRIRVPEHAQEKVRAALARNPNFEFVEPNFLAQGELVPNDPSYGSQWHLPRIEAPAGWELSIGSTQVPIAIIDSGVDPTHPDLAAKLLPGYSWVSGSTDTSDVLGHGTSVAGAAAAIGNNGRGIAGVSWGSPIMPLVVLNSSNSASYSNIASAIVYAVDRGVKVINVSIAGSSSSSTLQYAIDYAWNRGALVFCSAANYNTSTPYYPAALPRAIAVAATDASDNKASYSNFGSWISFTAPGSSIYTTLRGGGYGNKSGTSFSSPIAAGLGALIWSVNPQLSHVEVLDIIQQSADDLGAAGFDNIFGHGRINVRAALSMAQDAMKVVTPPVDQVPPVVALTAPAEATVVSGTVTLKAAASDDSGVERVRFLVNGALHGEVTKEPYALPWDTTKELSGWHWLQAEAVDAAGNVGQSEEVLVLIEEPVVDAQAPQVSIRAPLNGSKLANNALVDAQAWDNVGVVRMELYIDGALAAVSNSDTLSYRWLTNKLRTGAYRLTVKAFDAAGHVAQDSVTVYK